MTKEEIRKLPKVELHRHLDGSVRFETLYQYGLERGYFSSTESKQNIFNKVKILEPMTSLQAVLDSFWLTQKIMDSEEIIERIAFENVEDCYREGIQLVELRFAPVFMGLNKDSQVLNDEVIIKAVCRGVKKAMAQFPIAVGLIYIIPRGLDFSKNVQANKTLLKLLAQDKNIRELIVGADLADVENFEDMPKFVPLIDELREAGLKITIHSGEDTSAQHLARAMDLYRPLRIGHGIQVVKDLKVLAQAKEQSLHFEVCPTSNVLTRCAEDIHSHPIKKMWDFGLSLSINSDDPHLMNIDLCTEYQLLQSTFSFTLEQFKQINSMAFRSSFLSLESKGKVQNNFFI